MKTLTFLSLLLGLLLPNITFAESRVLAQIDENLYNNMQKIELLTVSQNQAPDQMIIRTTYKDSTVKETNMSQFTMSIQNILDYVSEANDPIVTKKTNHICYNIPGPRPKLSVLRTSRNTEGNTSALQVILTNVGCEFSSWQAPQSEQGETAARILYRLLLDGGKP